MLKNFISRNLSRLSKNLLLAAVVTVTLGQIPALHADDPRNAPRGSVRPEQPPAKKETSYKKTDPWCSECVHLHVLSEIDRARYKANKAIISHLAPGSYPRITSTGRCTCDCHD